MSYFNYVIYRYTNNYACIVVYIILLIIHAGIKSTMILYTYTYTHMRTFTHIYTYTHIYTHTHIYTYIHTYIPPAGSVIE